MVRVSHGRYRLIESDVRNDATPIVRMPLTIAPEPTVPGDGTRAHIALIGCVKTKLDRPAPARDLYRSPLFTYRRAYAERHADRYYILSAEHGLIRPDALLTPYDTALTQQSSAYRRAWGQWVVAKLLTAEPSLRGLVIDIHAGDEYATAVASLLTEAGAQVRRPLLGLSLGRQLSWYRQHEPGLSTRSSLAVIDGPTSSGAFTYQWPAEIESYDAGWTLTVAHSTGPRPIRIGTADRPAYGRTRRRLVVWIDGEPVAEAAGTDEYGTNRQLASLLKDSAGQLIAADGAVPALYASFAFLPFREVVSGPYARDGLAVCMTEDDVLGWSAYALARSQVRGALPDTPAPAHADEGNNAPAKAVVAALLHYGREHRSERADTKPAFTPHVDANDFLLADPFAFLLAVLFDQSIPAERAWRAPYDLRQRLGHLDPKRFVAEPDQIRDAVAQPSALHRYVKIMPDWLVHAARIVLERYDGDASSIWRDEPRAVELNARLRRFPGIGQKKAAMAVEILHRDLGVKIRDLSGSDIAYDVHVRRVFPRTRLAEVDDLNHMVEVARWLHPERPGELDYPAWLTGRRWCGPGTPDCGGCPLASVCPQGIQRAGRM
nr:hypothetical protein GCM10020063_084980 [Dactylosporangium thailandense]